MHWPVVGQLSFFFRAKKGVSNLSGAGWMEVFFYERMSKCWTPTESRVVILRWNREKTSELILKNETDFCSLSSLGGIGSSF